MCGALSIPAYTQLHGGETKNSTRQNTTNSAIELFSSPTDQSRVPDGSDYPAAMTKYDVAATVATDGDRLSSSKLQITSHVSPRDFLCSAICTRPLALYRQGCRLSHSIQFPHSITLIHPHLSNCCLAQSAIPAGVVSSIGQSKR